LLFALIGKQLNASWAKRTILLTARRFSVAGKLTLRRTTARPAEVSDAFLREIERTFVMADNTNTRSQPEARGISAEAVQRSTSNVTEATPRGAIAAQETASAVRQGVAAGAEATQRGSQAAGEVIRQGGEVLGRTEAAMGETLQHGSQAAAEGQRQFAEVAAEQFEQVGHKLAEAMQQGAQDMRRLMVLPQAAEGGLRDLQQALAGLTQSVMQTNLRAAQELFRLANPGGIIELQQRFAREYVGALIEGGTTILQAARRTTDEVLQPLERQLEQRRREQNGGQARQQAGARVADVMTRQVRVASPEDTVQQATRLMRDEDTGVLPVGENDRLVGMVTDRDVALRVAAEGRDPARTKVREVMTPEVRYVFEDEDLHRAADTMAEQQVRRLPVVNRDKRLVGIVSLGDMATTGGTPRLAGRALGGVAQDGGQHNQVAAE
jgi:CBS domain-containing protein